MESDSSWLEIWFFSHFQKQLLTNMGLWVDDSLQKNWWGYSLVSTIINNIQVYSSHFFQ